MSDTKPRDPRIVGQEEKEPPEIVGATEPGPAEPVVIVGARKHAQTGVMVVETREGVIGVTHGRRARIGDGLPQTESGVVMVGNPNPPKGVIGATEEALAGLPRDADVEEGLRRRGQAEKAARERHGE